MEYTFEIIGVSSVLSFFTHQLDTQITRRLRAEYVGAYQCTLDAFIESIEDAPLRPDWHLDRAVDSVIRFWLNNAEQVQHWKKCLSDAGSENLLVARLSDMETLRTEFEFLFEG
jgi:hypothetical protein